MKSIHTQTAKFPSSPPPFPTSYTVVDAGPQAAVQWLFDNEGQDLPPVGSLPAPSFTSRPAEPSHPPQVQSTEAPVQNQLNCRAIGRTQQASRA